MISSSPPDTKGEEDLNPRVNSVIRYPGQRIITPRSWS